LIRVYDKRAERIVRGEVVGLGPWWRCELEAHRDYSDALARATDMIESRRAASDRVPDVPEAGVSTPVTDASETAPSVVDYPESVYEEPSVGVPVGAGVPDSQS